jgi:hypothetical protein
MAARSGGFDWWSRGLLELPAPRGLAEAETSIPRRPGQTEPVAVYTVTGSFLYNAPDFSHWMSAIR